MDQDFDEPFMTPNQLLILRSIAITSASISLTSGLLVGYWFIRMKRSFRHQYVYCSVELYCSSIGFLMTIVAFLILILIRF